MKHRVFFLLLLFCGAMGVTKGVAGSSFVIGTNDFLLDGKPFQIRCGEMHFARIPREYWRHRLRMAHAMGLNTVCAYLFWNAHEPEPGKFDFTGNADVAAFCLLAQNEGLKVILRPGPYSCAEWDFGGLPWWLLKTPDIKVRTRDTNYLAACKRYLAEVGRQLGPLQWTKGGPIIMAQVENEYGSYGNDKDYIRAIRDYMKEAGFEVPLFTCDGPTQLRRDTLDDLFCVVNFDGGPESNFRALRQIRPTGPLMCGEYYPGWFDSWGKAHHFGDVKKVVNEIGWMLDHNASFSIYVVHGGTTFGFNAGANSPPFSPQSTSYDYDAPISEAGWETPKFQALRELMSKHLAEGEKLPDAPARNRIVQIAPFGVDQVSMLMGNLRNGKNEERPRAMEYYDQAHGCILYRTKVPAGEAGKLVIKDVHDYALVILNDKKVATLDRRKGQNSVELPARAAEATLDILVDTFGRVNYGKDIHDRKGITEKVELTTGETTKELTGWQVFNFPMDDAAMRRMNYLTGATDLPAFYRGNFTLGITGDTFLDMSKWGRGVVWVNGHNLGRYWSIGPQQTLYCPGPWLKEGVNDIVVFEFDGAKERTVAGLTEPILNQVKE